MLFLKHVQVVLYRKFYNNLIIKPLTFTYNVEPQIEIIMPLY